MVGPITLNEERYRGNGEVLFAKSNSTYYAIYIPR